MLVSPPALVNRCVKCADPVRKELEIIGKTITKGMAETRLSVDPFPRLLEFDRVFSHEIGAWNDRKWPLSRERYILRLFHETDFNMLIDLQAILAGKCETERDDKRCV